MKFTKLKYLEIEKCLVYYIYYELPYDYSGNIGFRKRKDKTTNQFVQLEIYDSLGRIVDFTLVNYFLQYNSAYQKHKA